MSQLARVAKVLRRNTDTPGITINRLCRATGLDKAAVYRRVYDLRMNEGVLIQTNTRLVNGKRKAYYRLAEAL